MTNKDRQIEIEYYKRRIKEDPEGKKIYMAELRKLRKK
jgi:hypothetical protein